MVDGGGTGDWRPVRTTRRQLRSCRRTWLQYSGNPALLEPLQTDKMAFHNILSNEQLMVYDRYILWICLPMLKLKILRSRSLDLKVMLKVNVRNAREGTA